MKIWAAILLFNITFFLVQPVFAAVNREQNITTKCCPESNKEKKECPKNCNPLFMCMYCQYLPAKNIKITKPVSLMLIKNYVSIDVNIFSGFVSSCWHPPDA